MQKKKRFGYQCTLQVGSRHDFALTLIKAARQHDVSLESQQIHSFIPLLRNTKDRYRDFRGLPTLPFVPRSFHQPGSTATFLSTTQRPSRNPSRGPRSSLGLRIMKASLRPAHVDFTIFAKAGVAQPLGTAWSPASRIVEPFVGRITSHRRQPAVIVRIRMRNMQKFEKDAIRRENFPVA